MLATAPVLSRKLLFNLILCAGLLTACGGEDSATLLANAQAKLAAGDHKTAMIQLKNAVAKDPNNAEARYELGKLYLDQNDLASAEKEFLRARESGYAASEVNPLLARTLLRQGEFQRVLDDLAAPADTDPSAATIQALRASALLGLGRKDEAGSEVQRAFETAPNNPDVHLVRAHLALAGGDIERAMEALDEALRNDQQHRDSLLLKADLLRATGKTAEAAAVYRAVVKADPRQINARLALARMALAQNKTAEARSEVDAALETMPNSLQARYTEALIDFREKKTEVARDHLAGVLTAAPQYVPALLLGGSIEYTLGNLQMAETHLKKVVKAAPNNLYAVRLLAATQLRLARPDDAARTLAPALRSNPPDAAVLVVAGEIAQAKKEFAQASAYFEQAAKLNPGSAIIRTELGLSRLAEGDERAMADLQAAADMEGANGRADTVIILSQLEKKQFDAALQSIAALEKKQGATPLTWNYRGAAHLGKRDLARARDSFNQALRLDPGFFPAAANLAELDLKDKQPGAARQRFEGILKADPKHLNAMLALADMSRRNKDEKNYVRWLEKAASAHPREVRPRVALARHLLAKDDKNRALSVAREAVNANPADPAALDLLGSVQMETGDNVGAIGTFSALIRKAPQSPDAYLRLASAQFAEKQTANARGSLQRALRLQPDHLSSLDASIRLELSEKKPDAALRIAREIAVKHPKSPVGYDREGDILISQKRYAEAVGAYEKSLEKGSGSAGFIKLFRAVSLNGNTPAAEQKLLAWLKKNPTDLAVRGLAADHYMVTDRNKQAIAQFQEIQRLAPQTVATLNNLAYLYHQEKDRRALPTAEQALKLAPDHPAVQDTAGWIMVENGQVSRGLALLRKAVAQAPDSPTVGYHYAMGLIKSGDRVQARKELQRVVRSKQKFPEIDEARTVLAEL